MTEPGQAEIFSYLYLLFGSYLINLTLLFLNIPFLNEFGILFGLLLLFSPCLQLPMCMFQMFSFELRTGALFEWSIYGAALCIFLMKVCFVASLHVAERILLVPVVLVLMAISQICAGNMMVSRKFRRSNVYLKKYRKTSKFEYFLLLMYVFSFIFTFCLSGPTGLSDMEVCSTERNKCHRAEFTVRYFFIISTISSLTVFYEALQVFKAQELVFESVYEPTGLIRKQRLIRKGWKWVIDDGPIRHIEEFI